MQALQATCRDDSTDFQDAETASTRDLTPAQDQVQLARAMNAIGSQIGELSINIADTSGMVGDVSGSLSLQADELHSLTRDISMIARSNQTVAEASHGAIVSAKSTHKGLEATTQSVSGILINAVSDIKSMATNATETTGVLDAVATQITEVHSFSEAIQGIATQTQILAVNAGIMAANAGDAGRGFAVIADAVKQLADKTGTVSRDMLARLQALGRVVDQLQKQNVDNETAATAAYQRSAEIESEVEKFTGFSQSVAGMITDIERISQPVDDTTHACSTVLAKVSDLDRQVHTSAEMLTAASIKIDRLVSFSEDVISEVAQSGVETDDTPLIRHCMTKAAEVALIFEQTIKSGSLSMADLFDENYQPLPDTDPQQYLTRFTRHTDRLLPPIQEAVLEFDPRVLFCAAIDRNGYLPTHNRIFSRPQGPDPVWNTAHCRNRRVFDDRAGLAAGRNRKPFLLQTYRRNMGGGVFSLMKDLSAPIMVNGRHWGGLGIGFKINA